MQIVIDIPDEAYELLKNKRVLDNIAESIIANGTPLPKGHGRLIDADAAKCSNCGKFGCENSDLCELFKAKTMIEADGGDEE